MKKAAALIFALLICLNMTACAPIADSPLPVESEDEGIPAAELVPSYEMSEDEPDESAPADDAASDEPMTEKSLLEVEGKLRELGYLNEKDLTEEEVDTAIKEFQRENDLPETGVLDRVTKNAMYSPAVKECEKPLEGLIIGLDPGHQTKANIDREPVAPNSKNMKYKVTGGTRGRFTGVPEFEVNLNVALMLRDLLEEQGATVVMTRETNDVDISNKARAQFFNEQQTDYALRLHCNGSDDASVHGAFMLVPTENPYLDECKTAAQLLIDAYCEKTGAKNLGLTYRSDQTGFNWSTRMVINIEMGHMTNEDEDKKLADHDYQKLMAQGLFDGIMKYFEN